MDKDMDQLFYKAAELYEAGYSVKEIALMLHISEVKSRRILITLGLWSSPSSELIGRLYRQGRSVSDIAGELSMSVKNVQAYIPYSKGTYGKETYDAVMSRNYRIRQQMAADKMRNLMKGAEGQERRPDMNFYERETTEGQKSTYAPRVMKLKLSLEMSHMSSEEMETLKTYGKVEEGITRTVLVPAAMPLHALHYLINQAFGWQNSHLHHFSLPGEIEKELTDGGRLEEWSRLCGVYFRFPKEYDDIFWDDDYVEGESPKTWMRRKYNGPYFNGARSEDYTDCQQEVQRLRERFSEIEVREDFGEMLERHQKTGEKDGPRRKGLKKFEDATIEELETTIIFDVSFYELVEHTPLYRILIPPVTDSNAQSDVRISAAIAKRFAVPVPVTDHLEYEYDYGDGWGVTIECADEFFQRKSADGLAIRYVNSQGRPVDEDEFFEKVDRKQKPVCTEADGLPVMDDAGGIYGYVDILRIMKEPLDLEDPEAAEKQKEYRAWARMQGWTGKKVKAENIL